MHNHRSNAGLPPLPDELPPAPQVGDAVAEATGDPNLIRDPSLIRDPAIIARLKSLRCGCDLVNYTPTAQGLTTFDGTIRMECHSNGRTASGDLYQRRVFFLPLTAALAAPAARRSAGRSRTRPYCRSRNWCSDHRPTPPTASLSLRATGTDTICASHSSSSFSPSDPRLRSDSTCTASPLPTPGPMKAHLRP